MVFSHWKKIGLALLLAASVSSRAMAAADVLVLVRAEDPPTADPGVEMSNSGYTLIYAAYEHLVAYKGATTEIVPELAENWSVDDANLVWTIKLATGHQFDDGTAVDAAAVKFSFDRLLNLKAGPSDSFPVLKEVQVVDPTTVRFVLSAPFAPFLSTLAVAGAAIVNPKVMAHEVNGDMAKDWLVDHTAGSGAYKISSWERNQRIVLDRNPHFSGPTPSLRQIVLRFMREASARRLQLVNGDADIIEQVPVDQAETLKKNPAIVVESNPSFYVNYIYLNNKRPPLDDVRVRQAISYAVDYNGLVEGLMQDQAEQMRGAVPNGMWGHDPAGFQYSYNIEKARALMKEAGQSNVHLTYTFSQADTFWEPVGLSLQASLAEIGIKLDLQSMTDTTKREMIAKGNYDLAPGAWTPDFADPYMFMNYWFDPSKMGLSNRAFYQNPKVTSLVQEAVSTIDQAQREKLYLEAQTLSTQDAPYLYLIQRKDIFARRAVVEGYVYNPMLIQIYNFETMSKKE